MKVDFCQNVTNYDLIVNKLKIKNIIWDNFVLDKLEQLFYNIDKQKTNVRKKGGLHNDRKGTQCYDRQIN